MLRDIVISDTSCFILLEKINALHLLHKTFAKVYSTPEVFIEFGNQLPDWVEIVEPENDYLPITNKTIDKVEASAIQLAFELVNNGENVFIVLDDLKARRYAISEGLNFIGTMAVVVMAKHEGVIEYVKPFF